MSRSLIKGSIELKSLPILTCAFDKAIKNRKIKATRPFVRGSTKSLFMTRKMIRKSGQNNYLLCISKKITTSKEMLCLQFNKGAR